MQVHYGVGRHAAYISPPQLVKAVQWIWLSTPFSTMSACFGKISISLLILRMINRNRSYTIFLWTLIFLLFVINLLLTIITFSQCTPASWLWDQLNPALAGYSGSCWHPNIQKNYGYFQGGMICSSLSYSFRSYGHLCNRPVLPLESANHLTIRKAFSAFSDLLLAVFPILIIKDLKIQLRLKIGLCCVMSLGIIATAAAAIKTVELKNLATPDFTYNATNLVYWFITENWVIIIAACVPTLSPLYFIWTGQRSRESFAVDGGSGHSGGSWGTK